VPKKGFKSYSRLGVMITPIVFVGGEKTKQTKTNKHFSFLAVCLKAKQPKFIEHVISLFCLQTRGFPLSIQEAYGISLPVITTNDEGYEMYNLIDLSFY